MKIISRNLDIFAATLFALAWSWPRWIAKRPFDWTASIMLASREPAQY